LDERVPELPVPRPPIGSPSLDRVVATAVTGRRIRITAVERGAGPVGEEVALILPSDGGQPPSPGETLGGEGIVDAGVFYAFYATIEPVRR
jgi:hypothetical protein